MSYNLETLNARELPPLGYAYDALEPYIDTKTMELHHDGHHAAYVNNLNKALAGHPGLEFEPVKSLLLDLNKFPEPTRTQIRNNGGGHLNHSMFWTLMSPNGGGDPKGSIASAIAQHFGSFSAFKQEFNTKAVSVFGSGWVWLSLDKEGKLVITTTPNQDNPICQGLAPIMGLDVWEHAYYLKYTHKRPSYIDAWWHVINWHTVEDNYRHLVK